MTETQKTIDRAKAEDSVAARTSHLTLIQAVMAEGCHPRHNGEGFELRIWQRSRPTTGHITGTPVAWGKDWIEIEQTAPGEPAKRRFFLNAADVSSIEIVWP